MWPQEHVLGLARHAPSLPLNPRELCVTVGTHLDSTRETGDTSPGFPAPVSVGCARERLVALPTVQATAGVAAVWLCPSALPQASRLARPL